MVGWVKVRVGLQQESKTQKGQVVYSRSSTGEVAGRDSRMACPSALSTEVTMARSFHFQDLANTRPGGRRGRRGRVSPGAALVAVAKAPGAPWRPSSSPHPARVCDHPPRPFGPTKSFQLTPTTRRAPE